MMTMRKALADLLYYCAVMYQGEFDDDEWKHYGRSIEHARSVNRAHTESENALKALDLTWDEFVREREGK